MKKEIQNQIKDKVINYLWSRIKKLSDSIIQLEKENNILKFNLIESLKHIFLIKSQYNISSPLERVLNNQNQNIKNKINQSVLESFSEINNSSYISSPNNVIKNFHIKIKRAMIPYNNNVNYFNLNKKRANSVYIKNYTLNNSLISSQEKIENINDNNLGSSDKEINISTITINKNGNNISKNNNKLNNSNKNNHVNNKYKKIDNSIKKNIFVRKRKNISVNSSSNGTILKISRSKDKIKRKIIFKRDGSLPKLPLDQIINFNN